MWEEVFKLALSNGLWAVLFCLLLVYQLRDSRKREQKYQVTIQSLVEELEVVDDIKKDTHEILKLNKEKN